jgi:conjugative relaxase-like TrwC/TraI family protein
MLSIKVLTRQNTGRVANYYEDGADDYYAKDGHAKTWQGRGAATIGLGDEFDPERFKQLLAGQVSATVRLDRSVIRDSAKERIGMDLTFSAPKSISIQALIGGDARLIEAHDRAVTAALNVAEERAQARRQAKGKTHIERTGNLIIAKFRHETSRDCDPQLHTHAVVMNLTRRGDGAWRALKNDEIVKSLRHIGAVYRSELALEVKALGYELRHEKGGVFELAHIGRDKIEAFSKRAMAIEAELRAKGLNRADATGGEKQRATMRTRARKTSMNRDEIFSEWQKQAKDLSIDFERRSWDGAGGSTPGSRAHEHDAPQLAAERAVRFAINHLTERQAVMNESDLVETAMQHSVGRIGAAEIKAEMHRQLEVGYLIREAPLYKSAGDTSDDGALTRRGWIDRLKEVGLTPEVAQEKVDHGIKVGRLTPAGPRYTTQTALEREKRILQIEREGRGVVAPIAAADKIERHLAGSTLNAGQRDAAALIASSENRVIGIQGFAGVGKSRMLEVATRLVEAEGYKVRAFAPYGNQVKALQELGVEAKTLASLLRAKDKQLDARTVIVLDEAGVVPTRQMEQLLKLAEQAGARIILVGDKAQTKAIEAGRPFDQLMAAGMETAKITEIQRQRDPILKAAVELAAQGQAAASLARLESVIEIAKPEDRRQRLVDDFVALSPQEREATLILAGTNEARADINAKVREAVGTAGTGAEFDILIRRDSTQAERRFSKNYLVGDIVQPEKDYKFGLQRGENYRVIDTGPGNRLTVESGAGERVNFSPMQTQLSLYQLERTEFAPNDRVRVTRNNAALDLATGERFKVVGIEKGAILLEGRERTVRLPTGMPLHVDHAYATTVHSAQGMTAERVLLEANTRSKTTAKDVYYVAISRAKHEARIYTDDAQRLPASISRENLKTAALDLKREREAGWERSR